MMLMQYILGAAGITLVLAGITAVHPAGRIDL
jgi:hypothetical protein